LRPLAEVLAGVHHRALAGQCHRHQVPEWGRAAARSPWVNNMLTFPPDITFVIQIVSFIVLWFGLKRLAFDPVQQVLEARDRRIEGSRREADEMRATAQGASTEYERRMQDLRVELAREAEAARSATQTEQRRVLAEARERAGAQVQEVRERLAAEAEAAGATLSMEARTLAARIVERVAGRAMT
jgi:F-type H+-transporting ATPase subunit b